MTTGPQPQHGPHPQQPPHGGGGGQMHGGGGGHTQPSVEGGGSGWGWGWGSGTRQPVGGGGHWRSGGHAPRQFSPLHGTPPPLHVPLSPPAHPGGAQPPPSQPGTAHPTAMSPPAPPQAHPHGSQTQGAGAMAGQAHGGGTGIPPPPPSPPPPPEDPPHMSPIPAVSPRNASRASKLTSALPFMGLLLAWWGLIGLPFFLN